MGKDATWKRCLSWAGVSFLAGFTASAHAQVVQNRTVEFPGGGTKNNNGSIGPFCCTGETAIIHDVDGKPAGYIYFYDFSGAKSVSPDQSGASTVSILISSGSDQTIIPSARFTAETWMPNSPATIKIGPLSYEVAIEPELITIEEHKYFDMASLKATVRVSSETEAPIDTGGTGTGAADAESASTEAPAAAPSVEATLPLEPSIDEVAREFVSEAMPMTRSRRFAALRGYVLPGCDMKYPNMSTDIEGSSPSIGLSPHVAEHFSAVSAVSPALHAAEHASAVSVVSPALRVTMGNSYEQKVRVAVDSAYIEQNLTAIGVPPAAITQVILEYRENRAKFETLSSDERKQMEDAHRSPEWRLVQSLGGVELPRPTSFKGPIFCTYTMSLAYKTPYLFSLAPAGGKIFLIPQFSFRVCQARKLNPYSRTECDNWALIASGQKAVIVGRYAYSAEWPDGRVARDVMDFSYDGKEVHTIPVSAPQN